MASITRMLDVHPLAPRLSTRAVVTPWYVIWESSEDNENWNMNYESGIR